MDVKNSPSKTMEAQVAMIGIVCTFCPFSIEFL